MSLGSKTCYRQKRKFHRQLHKQFIAAMEDHLSPVVVDSEIAESVDLEELYAEDVANGLFDDYDDHYYDDPYGWDYNSNESYDDYWEWDDHSYDGQVINPGSHYKHPNGDILLCCEINNTIYYVSLLTGKPIDVSIWELTEV